MKNNLYTIGVEEEHMICDNHTGELVSRANQIMNSLPENFKDRFSYELILSEIETNTSVNDNLKDTMGEISKLRNLLKSIGKKENFSIGISGTHPSSKSVDQTFVNNESYNWVSENLKYYATKNMTFSIHVHIGLDNPDKLIKITNTMRRWIAPMLALSVNSPFFENFNTGMKSSRTFQFGLFPRTEIPSFIASFSEYTDIINNYEITDSIGKPRHIWWKIRPHLDFNTIEFRVCDAQRSLKKVELIVGLLQSLVRSIDINKDYNHDYNYEYLTDGLWKAASKGLDSMVIDPFNNKPTSMREMVKLMLNYCSDSLTYFNNKHIIDELNSILDNGTECDQQLTYYKQNGMLELNKYLINSVEY